MITKMKEIISKGKKSLDKFEKLSEILYSQDYKNFRINCQTGYFIWKPDKLKEKEIVLAKGIVKFTESGYIEINRDSIRWAEKLGKLRGKKITLKAVVEDDK